MVVIIWGHNLRAVFPEHKLSFVTVFKTVMVSDSGQGLKILDCTSGKTQVDFIGLAYFFKLFFFCKTPSCARDDVIQLLYAGWVELFVTGLMEFMCGTPRAGWSGLSEEEPGWAVGTCISFSFFSQFHSFKSKKMFSFWLTGEEL